MVNGGVCGTAHLSPGDFLGKFFQLQMKELLWCKTKHGNQPIKKMFALTWPHLAEVLLLFHVRDKHCGKFIMRLWLSDSEENN